MSRYATIVYLSRQMRHRSRCHSSASNKEFKSVIHDWYSRYALWPRSFGALHPGCAKTCCSWRRSDYVFVRSITLCSSIQYHISSYPYFSYHQFLFTLINFTLFFCVKMTLEASRTRVNNPVNEKYKKFRRDL